MKNFSPIFLIFTLYTSLSYTVKSSTDSCSMHQHNYLQKTDQKFEQKTDRFWEFNEQSKTWVEIQLSYDLISCVNDNCTVVNSIQEVKKKSDDDQEEVEVSGPEKISYSILRVRKRISLTRMSETSIWVTGESGSIYERFWNGVQWVIAPHDLPVSAGFAVSVFIVNQTILALSEYGFLYQMQLTEDSQPVWVEFMPVIDQWRDKETGQSSEIQLSSGVVSNDRERMYFCTKNGSLLELNGVDPPRWIFYGRPPGANVATIADTGTIRPSVIFTLSDAGDLYEFNKASKPPWKKHIHTEKLKNDNSLAPIKGCILHGLIGAHSASLFLLTKGGELVERRLHQRKWKWILHGNPKDHPLSSITCSSQDELNDHSSNSLYLTTITGFIFEYRIPKYSGSPQDQENWLNHMHPPHTKVARGITGLQMQVGRMVFPLDDGRLTELHLSGFGGENFGPFSPVSTKRKSTLKYTWSILEAPESEGWNAEYCTEERGPSNCILGTKDETNANSRWRKDSRTHYLTADSLSKDSLSKDSLSASEYIIPDKWMNNNFRLRVMHGEKSFFLVTESGLTFEYLNMENVWLWLKHEHSNAMRGVLGNYNGILFLVDEYGSLFIRERSGSDLVWINCTAMKKGKQVVGGPPWDDAPGHVLKAKPEDAMFFVSKTGRLLQFTVAMKKFKWKDCRNPPSTKIACIVDQEGFRENVVFLIGRNGKLYQYNKVSELWHEHYQSQHLVLSRSSGTPMRSSETRSSLKGSLFMLSEDGGLVEYRWCSLDGWSWIEHGTPYTNVTLIGAPGPCFGEGELFLTGSDGNVYLRFLDQGEWRWRDFGFPYSVYNKNEKGDDAKSEDDEVCLDKELEAMMKLEANLHDDIEKYCDPKVTSTRPVPFSEDSVIFELRDGRLGEIRRVESNYWIWSRTIATPTSLCMANI